MSLMSVRVATATEIEASLPGRKGRRARDKASPADSVSGVLSALEEALLIASLDLPRGVSLS